MTAFEISNSTAHSPAKLILFGEWAVLGSTAPGIAMALSPLFETSLIRDPSQWKVTDLSPENTCAQTLIWSPQKAPESCPPFFYWTCRCLNYFSEQVSQHFSISFKRPWKLAEGLGSSSALFWSLWQIFKPHTLKMAPEDIWLEASGVLRQLQNGKGSGLDLAAQIFSQPICLDWNSEKQQKIPRVFRLKIPSYLYLIHTGHKVSTSQQLREKTLAPESLLNIERSTSQFIASSQNPDDWKQALLEHLKILKNEALIPPSISDIFDTLLIENKIQAYKSTGAGGGDAILVLAHPSISASWLEDWMRPLGYWLNLSFEEFKRTSA